MSVLTPSSVRGLLFSKLYTLDQPAEESKGEQGGAMTTDARYWMDQQAMERLAQHIPFETDPATKSELIEMLRGLAINVGRHVDREDFGFEARQELQRLGLWDRLGGANA
jgi:hypothetical protein